MPRSVGTQELQALIEGGVQLVEVLPRDEFEDEHLPGAVNIPLGSIDRDATHMLDPARPVVVYCYDAT